MRTAPSKKGMPQPAAIGSQVEIAGAPNDSNPIKTADPVLTPDDFSTTVVVLVLVVAAGTGLLVVVVLVLEPSGLVVVVVGTENPCRIILRNVHHLRVCRLQLHHLLPVLLRHIHFHLRTALQRSIVDRRRAQSLHGVQNGLRFRRYAAPNRFVQSNCVHIRSITVSNARELITGVKPPSRPRPALLLSKSCSDQPQPVPAVHHLLRVHRSLQHDRENGSGYSAIGANNSSRPAGVRFTSGKLMG